MTKTAKVWKAIVDCYDFTDAKWAPDHNRTKRPFKRACNRKFRRSFRQSRFDLED